MSETLLSTTINGRPTAITIPAHLTLAELLRDRLGLTGTKVSCGLQVCGACTVLVAGRPVSSCNYLALDCDGKEVTTVEGLAANEKLHPLQRAFVDRFAVQCGFCTPGFLMMAVALLADNADPSEAEIAEYLRGNLCRCTGYRPIIDAVVAAAEAQRKADK